MGIAQNYLKHKYVIFEANINYESHDWICRLLLSCQQEQNFLQVNTGAYNTGLCGISGSQGAQRRFWERWFFYKNKEKEVLEKFKENHSFRGMCFQAVHNDCTILSLFWIIQLPVYRPFMRVQFTFRVFGCSSFESFRAFIAHFHSKVPTLK